MQMNVQSNSLTKIESSQATSSCGGAPQSQPSGGGGGGSGGRGGT